jgi:hypothetical protein
MPSEIFLSIPRVRGVALSTASNLFNDFITLLQVGSQPVHMQQMF